MTSRFLDGTGSAVTQLGLGLAALGRPGYINLGHGADLQNNFDVAAMESRAHMVLDAALEGGVRYFDVARSYGRAEAFLASWLERRDLVYGAVTVGSKWGYTYTADWKVQAKKHEIKQHSLDNLRRQAAESCIILGPYLKLYQIHSATLESGVLENKGVLKELDKLRKGGLKIGLTLTGPNQSDTLKRALEVFIGDDRLFDCVQATWNLLEPSTGPMLQIARAVGLRVIVKESLANGRLTERNRDPAFAAKRKQLEEEAARQGTTLDAFCLAAAMSRRWADVVLSGAATVEQLHSNLAATKVTWKPDFDERFGNLAENPEDYWNTRAQLSWN